MKGFSHLWFLWSPEHCWFSILSVCSSGSPVVAGVNQTGWLLWKPAGLRVLQRSTEYHSFMLNQLKSLEIAEPCCCSFTYYSAHIKKHFTLSPLFSIDKQYINK